MSNEGAREFVTDVQLNPMPPTKALHYSTGKEGVDQIPPEVLMEWGKVFSYGEQKYARDNWKLGTDWYQFYGSALRHIYKFWMGEDIDPESELPHLAHAIWNIGCLRYYQLHGLGKDTRDAPTDPFAYSDEEMEARFGAIRGGDGA